MEPIRNIEEAIKNRFSVTAGRALQDRVLGRVRQADEQSRATLSASQEPVLRRILMRSSNRKWAVAATVIIAVGTGLVSIWHDGGSKAYAFSQTVEAMQGKRSFHIQTYFQQRRHDEFWAEFDKQGNLVRFRQEEDGGPKGPLITIWDNGILHRYYPAPRNLRLYARQPNTEHSIEGLEGIDPETIVQEIDALVKAGQAVLETDPLARYAKLMTLRVTHQQKDLEQVLVVNPITKFVVRVDDYRGRRKGEVTHHGMEVLEYNEAMDPKLFVPDFPQDAVLMDQVTREVGMAQGDKTGKEVAVKVVRQALEAWAQGDNAKAGLLFGGVAPEWFTKSAGLRPVRIVSVGEAQEHREWAPYWVPCQYEVEHDGRRSTITGDLAIRSVGGQPGRWYVSVLSYYMGQGPRRIAE